MIKTVVEQFAEQLDRIEGKLDTVLALTADIRTQETVMTAELTALTAQVAQTTTVEQSAIVLIQDLAAKFAAAKDDPAAIAALSTQLKSSADALAAAVVANTPAAP